MQRKVLEVNKQHFEGRCYRIKLKVKKKKKKTYFILQSNRKNILRAEVEFISKFMTVLMTWSKKLLVVLLFVVLFSTINPH